MKCQRCKREATVHVTDLVEGKACEGHFCDEHSPFPLPVRVVDEARATEISTVGGRTTVTVEVTQQEVDEGRSISVCTPGSRRGARIRLKPGMESGTIGRLRGKGVDGGDLYVKINIVSQDSPS